MFHIPSETVITPVWVQAFFWCRVCYTNCCAALLAALELGAQRPASVVLQRNSHHLCQVSALCKEHGYAKSPNVTLWLYGKLLSHFVNKYT